MNSRHFSFFAVTAFLIALSACSSSATKLDEKVAAENQVHSRADVRKEADDQIATAPGLTDAQRKELTALRASTTTALRELNQESLRLQSVLVKEVLSSSKDSRKEIASIKRRMRKNEDKRLLTIFDAVDKARKVLGRDSQPSHEGVFRDYFHVN